MEAEQGEKISFPVIGELIWINGQFPVGLTDEQFRRLDPRQRDAAQWLRSMRPVEAAHACGDGDEPQV